MIQLYDVFSKEEKGDFISEDNKIKIYRNGQTVLQTQATRIDKDD